VDPVNDEQPVNRTQRRREETRQRLIATALSLFATRGYESTTMNMIAETADVARTTVFNYFAHKDSLLIGALASRRLIIGQRLAVTLTQDMGTRDRIRDAVTHWAGTYQSDTQTEAALVRAWVQAGGPYLPGSTLTAELYTEALSIGQTRGDIRGDIDTTIAGLVLLDSTVGTLVRWAGGPPEHRSTTLTQTMLRTTDIVLLGMLTEPSVTVSRPHS
jgi:AcrR family transcriptional regulator